MARRGFEHFAHDADIGVRGYGPSKEAAFEEAARALTAVVTEPEQVRPERAVTIACRAPDDAMLLCDWLNALVLAMAEEGLLFGRFEVHIEGDTLTATAWGEPLDRSRHAPAVEVKGATLTALRVGREPDGTWVAQCVVDV
ncbi:archease [Benzoatithermus flavus]|uniref:Archease n=1 Tax=Benzoatithermus flavus TaxID=3108223 RepID=A0ABU8XQW6_9PROT